ncbi:MAG: UDP-N-acetylglucosamine 2-epimerase (non-hydrolyzing) [Candidatus Sulfotelmatobacter sp.]
MRIALVVGARPNVIKAAALVPALRARGAEVVVIHTGQHADPVMSQQICDELGLKIDRQLECIGTNAAERIGDMITALSNYFSHEKFYLVMVVGDCDSTLAGALVTKKLGLRLAHVEAGLRATDAVQENLNRILVDRMADDLFTSEPQADENLIKEGSAVGVAQLIHSVGNVMIDCLHKFLPQEQERPLPAGLERHGYAVLTLHRAENVDDAEKLKAALLAVLPVAQQMPIFFPTHPRTQKLLAAMIGSNWLRPKHPMTCIIPFGYLDFINLLSGARLVLTDSGGVQEETTALGIPCLTLRTQTERPATITGGTNRLVGLDPEKVREQLDSSSFWSSPGRGPSTWDGHAAERVAEIVASFN